MGDEKGIQQNGCARKILSLLLHSEVSFPMDRMSVENNYHVVFAGFSPCGSNLLPRATFQKLAMVKLDYIYIYMFNQSANRALKCQCINYKQKCTEHLFRSMAKCQEVTRIHFGLTISGE